MVHVRGSSHFSWMSLTHYSLIEPLAKLSWAWKRKHQTGSFNPRTDARFSQKNVSSGAHKEILITMWFPRLKDVRCIEPLLHYCHLREPGSHDNTWQAAGHMGMIQISSSPGGSMLLYGWELHSHRKGGSGAVVLQYGVGLLPFNPPAHL